MKLRILGSSHWGRFHWLWISLYLILLQNQQENHILLVLTKITKRKKNKRKKRKLYFQREGRKLNLWKCFSAWINAWKYSLWRLNQHKTLLEKIKHNRRFVGSLLVDTPRWITRETQMAKIFHHYLPQLTVSKSLKHLLFLSFFFKISVSKLQIVLLYRAIGNHRGKTKLS